MVLWALVCSLTVISALAATLDQLEAQRARVEAEQGALLAPTGYLRGVRALARAREATSDAARQKALAAAAAEFEAALQNIAIANEALDSVIESRDAANDAEAYRLAGSEWTKAEDWFGDAARKLEGGNLNAARERGARAEEAYRAAELTAIKVRCLSAARSAVSEAERARADRLAPRSLVAAQQALAAAEAALDTDRYATETPAADAARAEYLARLAIYISAQTQRVRDREATVEDLLLEAQSVMAELAEIAGTTPDFSNGYGNVAAELRAALKRIPVLEAELDQRRRQVVGLEEELRELDQRLSAAGAERRDLVRSLEANARVREQFDLVGDLFTPDEAVVLRDGDRLILRMVGLRFPSNSARLDDDARALLDRLETAIDVFPRCEVLVEGHTDSSGSPQHNQDLSQDRAKAVAEYLIETTGIQAFRVRAAGHGDTRPITTNRTAEGRAQNRRIDVVIVPQFADQG